MQSEQIDNLGIPPLAGICGYDEAARTGYSVEKSVDLLKRYNYVKSRLSEILVAHLPRTPEWEVKCGLSLHVWLDAEHSHALRKRVGEMREPPLHLDKVPDPGLERLLDEVIRSENTVELLAGVYRVVKPELVRAWRKHLAETNPIADHPTCRLIKLALIEEEEMIDWGERALRALTDTSEAAAAAEAWTERLQWFLQAGKGIAGDLQAPESEEAPRPRADGQPYQADLVPRRDARFVDPFNRRFFLRDTGRDAEDQASILLLSRLREMDVPEFMAAIMAGTKGKPWEYYVDMGRQLWDEARHAMMGEAGLVRLGLPFYKYPVELHGSMSLNVDFEPTDAHLILWHIEQTLMRRDIGKARELAQARASGDELLTTFQDYDWADEVLHAQIGRRWLLPAVGNLQQMRTQGAELYKRWEEQMDKLDALSEQREWWPDFLAEMKRRRAEYAQLQAQESGDGGATEAT